MATSLWRCFLAFPCFLRIHSLQVVSLAREGATSIPEIETRLSALGRNVGVSLLELVTLRDKGSKREVWPMSWMFHCCDASFASHLSLFATAAAAALTSLLRQVRLVPMLTFISQTLWKSIFGKVLLTPNNITAFLYYYTPSSAPM